jgi:hypothetical protein
VTTIGRMEMKRQIAIRVEGTGETKIPMNNKMNTKF